MVSLIAALSLASACGSATDPVSNGGPQPTALTALPRALTAGEQAVVGAANGFSFSLFRQVNTAQPGANVFTSPLSASMALGMTMNGAANATYDQMRSALAFGTASESDIDQGYKSLIALLRGLDASVDFRIANSIWYSNTYPFNQSFLDAGTNYFDAKVSGLDFNNPSTVSTINAWVSTATNSRIPSIIDTIDPDLKMVLVNAMYFKGAWRDKFDAALTGDAPFHGVGGDKTVKLMHRNASMSYFSTPDFDAVDLPYGNTAFTMTVLLPKAGKSVETIASTMQAADWASWTPLFRQFLVDLYLPRFAVTWERQLNGDLQALGMHDAFVVNGADFTRMSPRGKELLISYVKQKTFVDVNEEGTEAAAVTSVGVVATSAQIPFVFRVDRPFVFVLRER
ncbi:MAG: serpin family protein, partial [bacterium]